MTFNVNMTIQK